MKGTSNIKPETILKLNRFIPRPYQLPILDAIENKGYKRVLAILPRRAGKDMTAFNLCIRACLRKVGVYYYIFPTYSQAKKVIWDSITNSGARVLDYIPEELVASKNGQEMKIRFVNGSLLQLVGSDNFDCYDDETEILTENGWKLFCNLNKNEMVATLDTISGELRYGLPYKYIEEYYEGDLYSISNSSIDFRVTPNHKFWVKSPKGVYKFKEISDETIRYDAIPSQSKWVGNVPGKLILGYLSKEFIAFLGIFLSEGSTFSNEKCYRITISQTKSSTRSKIRLLLQSMGLNFVEYDTGFNIENQILYDYCSQFGLQPVRFIPKDIKMLNNEHLKILLDWLVLGDGYKGKGYTAYYSTSKRLVDDVQEIIIKLGMSGNVSIKSQKQSVIRGRIVIPRHTLYEVRIRTSKFKRFHGSNGKPYIHKVAYKGKIYCVSVRPREYGRDRSVIKVRRNGKEYWSGNSLMGTNPQGCIFSEYALQDPRAYQYIRPILTANDGWALFLSTPRGKNHLWELYQIAQQSPDWFAYLLTIEQTRHIPMSEIAKEKAEGIMSDDLIQQEYFCSFDCGVEGSYYAKYLDKMRLKGQIGQVPWESGFKVHVAIDIGVRDSTVILFFQVIGQVVRIIDYYENSKEGLEHYVKVLQNKPYSYGKYIAPHDIKVKEFGTGMTRLEKARQLGINFVVAPDVSIMDGIESVRSALSKIWIDEVVCAPLIKALEGYRQEFDVKKKVYKNHPLHDHNSHAADAMRYLCISLPKTRDGASPEDLDKRYAEAIYGNNNSMPNFFKDEYKPY